MKKQTNLDSMKQSQDERTQNLRKWRAARLHEETLPSGLTVTLRDVDIPSVVIDGNVPNTLMDLITADDFQGMTEEEAGKKILGENLSDFNTLLKLLLKASLVEPAIGDEADDKHILYTELSFEDKMFIFNFLKRDVEAVRSFRDESEKSGESSQPG